MTPDTTTVVVVGAGPVGLTTALLLASRGVAVLLLERNEGTSDTPKAISLDDESLRTFATAGVLPAVLPIITPGTGTMYFGVDGQVLFQARAQVPFRSGHPFKNPFAQPELERVLAHAAAAHPLVDMRFSTAFRSLNQRDDGTGETVVTTDGLATGAVEQVRCRYVLGCDGGRSTVREALGIGMKGRSHAESWLVVDTVGDAHDELYGMHHGDPRRPHVIIPGRGGRCRYEVLLRPEECPPDGQVPLEVIQRLLAPFRRVTGTTDVERAVAYRFHSLVAETWSRGNAFLLGDAAHMMPPFAGQGLNSGIRDAANLTWKLADVLAERLDPVALTTYETERRPHAEATVRLSAQLGRVVMTTRPGRAAARDRRVRAALATPGGRAFLEEMRYRPVPDLTGGLCVTDERVLAGANGPVGAGGALGQPRVFDLSGHRVVPLDEVLGPGWALIGVGVTENDWTTLPPAVRAVEPRHVAAAPDDHLPIPGDGRVVVVDVDGSLQREVSALRGRFVLVRPDRFIAATWTPSHADRVEAGLDPWRPSPPRSQQRGPHMTCAAPSSDIDLWDDEALSNPYPLYAQLRNLGPVVHLRAHNVYAIPRYEPLRQALADWHSFSSARGVMMNDHVNSAFTGIVLHTDPPEHDVMRKVLAAPLRPDQLRAIAPSVRAEADAVVDRLFERGRFDAATDLAQHLPLTVVSTLVGLGDFGRERMLEWAAATFDAQGPMERRRTRDAFPKLDEMVAYATEELTADRVPPEGWVAALYAAADRGELPADKPGVMAMDYTGPALDTTIFATSSAIWLFAQNPDQWDLIRENPALIPHAINEVVRLESPIQRFSRVTTREIDVDGHHLPEEARVLMLFGSGNRDERKYPDPERFDVRRKPSDHLAFGHGVHACVGMNLARLEIRLLLEALAAKVERFEILGLERAINSTLRGIASLEVSVR